VFLFGFLVRFGFWEEKEDKQLLILDLVFFEKKRLKAVCFLNYHFQTRTFISLRYFAYYFPELEHTPILSMNLVTMNDSEFS